MPKLNIMVGLPGSGKSTYAKNYLIDDNTIYLSSDDIRIEMFGFEDQTHNSDVFNEMQKRTLNALRDGKNVIYDATNLSKKRRSGIISEARKLGAQINAYLCCTPINIILERNITRVERQLPWDKLVQMIQSIEPPMYYEGFDNIYLIDGGEERGQDKKWLLKSIADSYFYDQNNPHHTHTLGAHIYLTSHYYENNNSLSKDDKEILYTSGLWHDISKPYTKTVKNGISHYYNHEKLSAYMYLNSLLPLKQIDKNSKEYQIYQIIYHHMDFYKNIEKTREKLDENVYRLLELFHMADKYRIGVDMNEEIWAPIEGTNYKYFVSNYGRIKRNNKILKLDIQKSDHSRITLSVNNKQKRFLIHRLVAQVFIPNPNNYKQVGHFDGNPLNNNVFNLYWCNQKQNINNEISRLNISESKKSLRNPMYNNHKKKKKKYSYYM